MPFHRAGGGVAVMAVGLALASCSATPAALPAGTSVATASITGTPCGEVAVSVVDALQDYVDSFGSVDATDVRAMAGVRASELQAAAARLRERAEAAGCTPELLADLVRADIGRLRGDTPVQEAVAATFRADPLGTLDPSDPGVQDFEVASAAELRAAVGAAGDGSVIRLAAGTYDLAEPLVLLRPITLLGAGPDATVVTSSAGGATLVGATDGTLTVRDLTIAHTGQRPASVALMVGGGYDLEGVRLTGGRGGPEGGGFALVLRPYVGPLTATATHRLDDVTAADSAGGGVVVAGDHEPTIRDLRVSGTDGCGLCFVEDGAGSAEGVTVSDASVGVRVDHARSPELSDVVITGGDVGLALTGSGTVRVRGLTVDAAAVGIQAVGSGRLELSEAEIDGATELGARMSGTTTLVAGRLEVTGSTPVAVALVEDARAELDETILETTGDAGLVGADRSTGAVARSEIRGARLGVQLADAARLDLTEVTTGAREAAVLAGGTSAGQLTGLTCGDTPAVLREGTAVELVDSPTCRVVREG